MTDHEPSGLVGAYAVDALDEPERAEFEDHLADCVDCTAEVASLRAAAAELSHTSAIGPPEQLRADLLSAIGQVRPLPPRVGTVSTLGRRMPRRGLWPAVAAACALIAVVALGWGAREHQQLAGHRLSPHAVSALLDSGDLATVSAPIGRSGHATLIYSKAKHRLVLIGQDIPAPPAGKAYQVWMLSPTGAATSGGVFRPDENGTVLVQASGDLAHTAQMGISIERASGAGQPTPGAIVAEIPI
jgi:anti-sigma-K factor RskA